jgi:hypothetical protein
VFFLLFSVLGGVSCLLFGVEWGSEAEESGVVKGMRRDEGKERASE